MVQAPAGEFEMGDDGGEADERPSHTVRLGAFWIDATEVTQQSFEALMGRNPAKFPGPDRPVERVSWFAAIQYCNARSLKEGLGACYDLKTQACDFSADGYRLPTEAEWEYACRAGKAAARSQLADEAWYAGNSGHATHPVRQKSPNAWGLYDMYGNVAEWCNDFYAPKYSGTDGPQFDPRGPASGQERVLRGGSWSATARECRSAARASAAPGLADVCFGYEAYGFRCVRRVVAGR
jgi:formylglycine-generating enzyme required for sulfatase activity